MQKRRSLRSRLSILQIKFKLRVRRRTSIAECRPGYSESPIDLTAKLKTVIGYGHEKVSVLEFYAGHYAEDQPIYLFGLKDRDEYDLSANSNLMNYVKEFLLLNGLEWKVTEGIGCNRLGISYSLRQNNFSEVINLIKQISHR